MDQNNSEVKNRRSFLRSSIATGAAIAGAGVLGQRELSAQGPHVPKGDIAILKFLAAAELIESDLWTQYEELGGIGSNWGGPFG